MRSHLSTPPSAARGPYSPTATTRAAFASLPSAMLRPQFLAQSHTFSRNLSCNAPASRLPVNPFNRPKSASNVNPVRNRDAAGQSNNCIMAVSPALTQYEIRNSAPNLLRPPCRSLDHRINCTHSRKTKVTANHLCTLTNVYCLTEYTQLQDHNAAAPDATLCAHPQTFFSERARQRMNSRGSSRHFALMPPTHLRHTGTPPQLMRHCAPPTATRFAATRSTNSSLGTASRPGRRSITAGARYPEVAQSEFYAKLRFHIAPGTKLSSPTIDPPEVMVWQVKLKTRLD